MKILRLLGMTVVIAVPAMFVIGGLTFPCVVCVPRISAPVLISDLLLLRYTLLMSDTCFSLESMALKYVESAHSPGMCGRLGGDPTDPPSACSLQLGPASVTVDLVSVVQNSFGGCETTAGTHVGCCLLALADLTWTHALRTCVSRSTSNGCEAVWRRYGDVTASRNGGNG